jgi:hypothetical protein
MMKEYTVRYHLGAYVYESVVRTSSSHAALLWAKAIGGYNPVVMKELELVDE